jgi:hypothetical protein
VEHAALHDAQHFPGLDLLPSALISSSLAVVGAASSATAAGASPDAAAASLRTFAAISSGPEAQAATNVATSTKPTV